MRTYSQRDPSYGSLRLGGSRLTVHGYGCFLASIATLYQRPVTELLFVPGGFPRSDGLLSSTVLAKYCGGEAAPRTNVPPKGWCVAVTDHYTTLGVSTHFFVYHPQRNLSVDPLDFPATVESNKYRIVHYRPFTNILFNDAWLPPTSVFPDVPNDRWSAESIRFCKEKGIINGYPDGTFQPDRGVTREEVAVIIHRALSPQ